jgi:WD40 repeat protein
MSPMRTVLASFVLLVLCIPAAQGDELSPTATIKLSATVPDLYFSPDRSLLYLLNTSEGKIQRIDTAKRKLDSVEGEAVEAAERMTLSPDGKTIYVCASPEGHKGTAGKAQTGKIQVLDAATLKEKANFKIPLDPFDIKAGAGDQVFVSGGSGQWTNIALVDAKKKSITNAKVSGCWMGAFMEIMPDGKRLYHCSLGISPPSVHGVWLGAKGEQTAQSECRSESGNPVGGWFYITPDGKFLISSTGTVLRLAKGSKDDLKPAGKVERHLSCACDKNSKLFFVGTADGSLKVYSYPDFELKTSYDLKAPACRMLVDAASNTLYCAVETKKSDKPFRNSPTGVGDIHIYDITKVMKE